MPGRVSVLLVPAAISALLALPAVAGAQGSQRWSLKYSEDFSAPMNTDLSPWEKYNYERPVDNIMDDNGDWWKNDYGEDKYLAALNSYQVFRKNVRFGTDNWLTATLSARDWAKDGTPDVPPTISTKELAGQGQVLDINSPDAADGAFLTTSQKLPQQYRLEYRLKTLDFGGERNGTVNYDGKSNGYSLVPGQCKSQFPHAEGIGTPGWNSQITTNPCDYQSVTEGRFGYNAFHLIGIVDFANPEPSNLHFWHYRRKILMDSFAQHPDRVGTGSGGRVCDPVTNTFYTYRESTKNVVDMWINGLPNFRPGRGGITGNGQYFHTTCTGGTASNQASPSAAVEFRPEVMPGEDYLFAVEKTATGYNQEVTGNFGHGVGVRTIRFERPFIVNNVPIWHYNSSPDQYNGQYNNTLRQTGATGTNQEWPDQWPAGSAYPDFPVIGDPYTDAGEGNAKIDSIRLFVPDTIAPTVTFAGFDENAIFTQGRKVTVTYSCADPRDEGQGSGLKDCVGDVPSGGQLDTSTPGEKTFTVTATDNAGNTTAFTRRYVVLPATNVEGTVGGDVPATLALSLGAASFGTFVPGVERTYSTTTEANVISTAANAALTVSDPGHLTNGAFSLPDPLQVELSKAAWTTPVSNESEVGVTFKQHIGAGDALRTGSYSKTLTFTLSTTTP